MLASRSIGGGGDDGLGDDGGLGFGATTTTVLVTDLNTTITGRSN